MTQQKHETTITKAANKKLIVVRKFEGTTTEVWKAWTESALLDQWWAPRPWKANTKKLDFKTGGFWLYCMEGPNGEKQWCRVDFKSIDPPNNFIADAIFSDEEGNRTGDFPVMHWKNVFSKSDTGTTVTVEITFDSEEDLEKVVAMGFKEGFTMAHGNLDELLAK